MAGMKNIPSLTEPVGLFPLPNVVLLPGAVLPLQVFEDRYRAMVADALEERELIAMALLQPGYEPLYHTNLAEIHPVVCVGRIAEHVCLPDGRYFLNLLGLCRARVRTEDRDGAYRRAMVDPMLNPGTGIEIDGEFAAREMLRHLLNLAAFDLAEGIDQCRTSLDSEDTLDEVLDHVAAAVLPGESIEVRQKLLEEVNPLRRCEILLPELKVLQQALENRQNKLNEWPRFGSMN